MKREGTIPSDHWKSQLIMELPIENTMAKQKNNQQGKALNKTKPVPNPAKRSKRASATQISPNQQTSSDANFGGVSEITTM
ncbi:hypothetical protein OUZ56_007195 [Daphnia magna]|uniref:Uncharacterized protein n=1 Tax=Daphnia magna TaxID=35525 RepID=A0ABQ9YY10_9CRUS|nr:hypothetical protein OUZ56_007195 [Daphnia magna]